MKKFFVDILTVANGQDYDVGRVMLLAGFVFFNLFAAWALFKNQPWSAQDYGIGLGALMGGGGAGLWFKRNTEPG